MIDDDEKFEELELPWNILIVDDDIQIHHVTNLTMKNFLFDNRPLKFTSVYSGVEAKELLEKKDEEYALILLDVVMEEIDSGLKVADYIRNTLKNHYSRIILRTGQAGLVKEYSVIKNYEIDSYKSKTELKIADLEALFYTTLRSYRDIMTIKNQRESLEQVISSITKMNSATDLSDFASALLDQLQLFLGCEKGELLLENSEAYAIYKNGEHTKTLAVSKDKQNNVIDNELQSIIDNSFKHHNNYYTHPHFVHFLETQRKNKIILSLKSKNEITIKDQELLNLFSKNVAFTYENLLLSEEVYTGQNILAPLLGAAMEGRSKETRAHIKRMGEFSAILGTFIGLRTDIIAKLRISAQLHDVGKVWIPESILNKPGKLNSEEWVIMKKHSSNGYEILQSTDSPIINMASNIALEHHEWWDGTGYPDGKKGDEISIEGRIVAMADVFDALLSKKSYKEPWDIEKVYDLLEKSKGNQFDPDLVDIFLKNRNIFYNTYLKFKDENE